MKKIIETVTYTCDWCGEIFNPSNQLRPIVLDTQEDDVEYYLAVHPIVYIAGEPYHDVCVSCVNKGILKYIEGLKT